MVHVLGLSKRFAMRAVLRDVECELCGGEIVALTGANGAGKTTLLDCLAGILRPDAGDIRWGGDGAAGGVPRQHVGIVPHEPCWYSHLTMRENLLFAARMHRVRRAASSVTDSLESLGLASMADCLPLQLSQGIRKRYAMARAFVHGPSLLLLDEPFVSLDEAGQNWLAGVLRDLRARGCAVCFATHDLDRLPLRVDRLLHLHHGKLVERTARMLEARLAA